MGYSKPPLGRAEQRSSVRIKALALSERSEFASAPNAASSARDPKGTDVARFFLAKQKKVTRPPGRDPASHRSTTKPAQQTPSLLPQGNHKGCPYTLTPDKSTARRTPTPSPLTPHPSPLTPHPSPLTPHSSLLPPHPSPLTPPSSLLTPHSSLLTPHPSLLTPHSYDLTPHLGHRTHNCKGWRRRPASSWASVPQPAK